MKIFLIATLSILMSVTAQFLLKTGMSSASAAHFSSTPLSAQSFLGLMLNTHILGGFLMYGLGAMVWLAVLSQWDVSKAYPLVGMGFAITVGVGMLMGEQVSASRIVGVALICTGVLLVGRS